MVFIRTEFIVIFSTAKVKKQEENYWVVGLNKTSLCCIACKHPELFPQVMYIIVAETMVLTLSAKA